MINIKGNFNEFDIKEAICAGFLDPPSECDDAFV